MSIIKKIKKNKSNERNKRFRINGVYRRDRRY